jgi:hypothetical protein
MHTKEYKFRAMPSKDDYDIYVFWAKSHEDARHWVINHLDLSGWYTITKGDSKIIDTTVIH